MKFLRIVLATVLLAVLLGSAWLWLNLPAKVDLAEYAPADSILYIEFNSPAAVVQAIQDSDVWKAAAPLAHTKTTPENGLLTAAARAGIGPIEAVLFARSQIALVVVGLETSEQGDTLRVRPEVALIAETHTSKWRTKPAALAAVGRLATFAYGASSCSERSAGADYIECTVAGAERKIVAAVDGTLVVIGNTEHAVQTCLETRRGRRPNIRTDAELLKVRSSVTAEKTLGFGYISSTNSAKLFSWVAPLLMGKAPGDRQLEQLLSVSAGKILRGVAWTAVSSGGGIEDRFLFSLEPDVISRLQPAFVTAERDDSFWKLVPGGFQSLTIYRSKEPAAAWSSLDSAVAFKLDALPAVLFGALLRSSLSVYGISNPKEVLDTLSPPLLTLKPSAVVEGSVLVARVSDEARLRRSLAREVFKGSNGQILEGLESDPKGDRQFSAVFADGYVLLGKTENMRSCLTALRKSQAMLADDKQGLRRSAQESSATILTYSNDEERLTNFISTLLVLQGKHLSSDETTGLQNTLRNSTLTSTETRLNSAGIERKTQSAFGQFSTFISLLQSDSSGPLVH